MSGFKDMVREFDELLKAVERLKQVEKELEGLNPRDTALVAQVESIRVKLKQPGLVEEVEGELNLLRKQMEVGGGGATVDFPIQYAAFSFPRELDHLYSDTVFIGSGGFGKVFKARRRPDGVEVAVKVPEKFDVATGKSFVREISSWHLFKHTNIVELYDYNILPIPYLEMELCETNLNELSKPMDVKQAASVVMNIAEGLEHAHYQKMVHRDLKPQNILIRDDVPKISDWGMCKVLTHSRSSSDYIISPHYAAPEQLAPQFGSPDHRTDIYQLGAIFYELVAGELPFKGDNIVELMAQIINVEPKAASSLNPEAKDIEPIIMKCLCKQMNERYQDVVEVQRDLAEYLST